MIFYRFEIQLQIKIFIESGSYYLIYATNLYLFFDF